MNFRQHRAALRMQSESLSILKVKVGEEEVEVAVEEMEGEDISPIALDA